MSIALHLFLFSSKNTRFNSLLINKQINSTKGKNMLQNGKAVRIVNGRTHDGRWAGLDGDNSGFVG